MSYFDVIHRTENMLHSRSVYSTVYSTVYSSVYSVYNCGADLDQYESATACVCYALLWSGNSVF